MAVTRHFGSFTETRKQLPSVLNAAHEGVITTVTRDNEQFVVVPAKARREELHRLLTSQAVVVAEGGGWAALIPGVPVHGEADTLLGAIDDLIGTLRVYAEDWNDRLYKAPNHAQHRSLVELIELSEDEQLREWLLSTAGPEAAAPQERLSPTEVVMREAARLAHEMVARGAEEAYVTGTAAAVVPSPVEGVPAARQVVHAAREAAQSVVHDLQAAEAALEIETAERAHA